MSPSITRAPRSNTGTRIDTWPRLRNADKAWRDISSFYPTEPTPLAFQRELWQLPLGKDTIQSIAKPYADVRVKHIVDFALEAERKCGHRQLVIVTTLAKNYMIALDALPNSSGALSSAP